MGSRLEGAAPPLPEPAQLHEAFLWRESRTVTKTATVSLLGNTYEVDPPWSAAKSSWSSTRST